MNEFLQTIWSTAQPVLTGLKAEERALLLVLAASLVVVFALRERCLLVWSAGWALLAASRVAEFHGAAMGIPQRYVPAVEQATFVLAIGLFAGGIFVYVRGRNLIVPLAAVTFSIAAFAAARVLLWPDLLPLRVALEVSYLIIQLTAAIALLRARRGRGELTPVLLAASLLVQHLSWPPYTRQIPSAVFVTSELALGLCMLMVVLLEAR